MKKLLKELCLIFCIIFVFSSCNSRRDSPDAIRNQSIEYVIKFDVSNQLAHFVFYITPQDELIAYYEDSKSNYEEVYLEPDCYAVGYLEPYIERVLTLSEDDIENPTGITDFWTVKLDYNDISVIFDYGISNSTDVNVLLEQIIGSCNFKEKYKKQLVPWDEQLRFECGELTKYKVKEHKK